MFEPTATTVASSAGALEASVGAVVSPPPPPPPPPPPSSEGGGKPAATSALPRTVPPAVLGTPAAIAPMVDAVMAAVRLAPVKLLANAVRLPPAAAVVIAV